MSKITLTLIELELKRVKWEWTCNETDQINTIFQEIANKMFYAPHQIILYNRNILKNEDKEKTLEELDFNDGQTVYFFEEACVQKFILTNYQRLSEWIENKIHD
eukprot:TRINITY_DN14979_c0_g1_i1.p1 TRINITY_DN14979_c0_g1~~TRINITY_DN14979_c0_g1_i1.p1  ORF type:complete len:104 (+),score=29.25 TRINITY_DN14979_c0_g1_i1:80-391(+)